MFSWGFLDVTKPYKFIGFGAIDVTKPYQFTGFGAIDVTKPYVFMGLLRRHHRACLDTERRRVSCRSGMLPDALPKLARSWRRASAARRTRPMWPFSEGIRTFPAGRGGAAERANGRAKPRRAQTSKANPHGTFFGAVSNKTMTGGSDMLSGSLAILNSDILFFFVFG